MTRRASLQQFLLLTYLREGQGERYILWNSQADMVSCLQTKMAQGKWAEIDYERVASLCMKIKKSLFIKHDKERLTVRPAHSHPC